MSRVFNLSYREVQGFQIRDCKPFSSHSTKLSVSNLKVNIKMYSEVISPIMKILVASDIKNKLLLLGDYLKKGKRQKQRSLNRLSNSLLHQILDNLMNQQFLPHVSYLYDFVRIYFYSYYFQARFPSLLPFSCLPPP